MRKSARALTFPFVAILATLALLCASFVGFGRAVSSSTQCPTAAVQRVTVAVRDCCDRIVGYETRAPKPGERDFVTCNCSAKKALSHKASFSAKIEFILCARDPELAPTRLATAFDRPAYLALTSSIAFPPRVRPPASA